MLIQMPGTSTGGLKLVTWLEAPSAGYQAEGARLRPRMRNPLRSAPDAVPRSVAAFGDQPQKSGSVASPPSAGGSRHHAQRLGTGFRRTTPHCRGHGGWMWWCLRAERALGQRQNRRKDGALAAASTSSWTGHGFSARDPRLSACPSDSPLPTTQTPTSRSTQSPGTSAASVELQGVRGHLCGSLGLLPPKQQRSTSH